MTDQPIQPKDDRLLTEREVAERWNVSARTMREVRRAGDGPPFVLNGNRARYLLSEVLKFEDGGLLTQEELAARWGITVRAVQKRDKGGVLPGRVKLSGLVRYRLNKIIELDRSQTRTKGVISVPQLNNRVGA